MCGKDENLKFYINNAIGCVVLTPKGLLKHMKFFDLGEITKGHVCYTMCGQVNKMKGYEGMVG